MQEATPESIFLLMSRMTLAFFAVIFLFSTASANDLEDDPRVQMTLGLLEVWADAETVTPWMASSS